MNIKIPKQRDRYRIRLEDGVIVDVTREVYLAWYQSRRQERYQKEKERKNKVYSLEAMQEQSFLQEEFLSDQSQNIEELVINKSNLELLREFIEQDLEPIEAELMYLFYFENKTIKEVAGMKGWTKYSTSAKKKEVLQKLLKKFQGRGIEEL